jgi:5-oxoprolinase (ATP-hydrolysing)
MRAQNASARTEMPLCCIDQGGTFTDCLFLNPGDGRLRQLKLLSSGEYRLPAAILSSESPGQYRIQIRPDESLRLPALSGFQARLHPSDPKAQEVSGRVMAAEVMDSAEAGSICLLVRVNASELPEIGSISLYSGESAPVTAARLLTGTPPPDPLPPLRWRLAGTQTTNALLEARYAKTALIVTQGFADMMLIGSQARPDIFALEIKKPAPLYAEVAEVPGRLIPQRNASGNAAGLEELQPLRPEALAEKLPAWREAGIETVAISLLHSWQDDRHEQALKSWLEKQGFSTIILSSETAPLIHYHDRTQTTLVNAILTPVLADWRHHLENAAPGGTKKVMSSAGGLKEFGNYRPVDSLLSGPAAGVSGAAGIGERHRNKDALPGVLSFDMGGTSTDVARTGRRPELRFSHKVGQAELMAPAVDIETVAAGGGSVCRFDGHRLSVGPESAGAHPGPACYGRGGPLTITDVNLLSGRLPGRQFSIPLFKRAAEAAFEELRENMATAHPQGQKPERISLLRDLLDIANRRMADAIRAVSTRRGYEAAHYPLVSFGGAGGQHACAIAGELGIRQVIFPKRASVLSAFGLMQAPQQEIAERQLLMPLPEFLADSDTITLALREQLHKRLPESGADAVRWSVYLMMRLPGQNTPLPVCFEQGKSRALDDAKARFEQEYERVYGIRPDADDEPEVAEIRMVAELHTSAGDSLTETPPSGSGAPEFHEVAFSGRASKPEKVKLYQAGQISGEEQISGPALIQAAATTVYLEAGWRLRATESGDLLATRVEQKDTPKPQDEAQRNQAAALELDGNRLQGIANEMGEVLQRTAVSVNIKERLDYSCAVFDARGYLVANAAHIPVHLGALGRCVRAVMADLPMQPGEAYLTNHPGYGGSHLPDLTVITPCFDAKNDLAGFVASRAHHAEIGGKRPGSMVPDARNLAEEGCVLRPMRIMQHGKTDFDELRRALTGQPYPTRSLKENLADVASALAANQRGVKRLLEWQAASGRETIQQAMENILEYGHQRLLDVISGLGDAPQEAEEQLDDGSRLKVHITKKDGQMQFNFEGTSPVHPGNMNATPAIVESVVMYVLRVLVNEPIPLNEGLMRAVQLRFPKQSSLLNPDFALPPEQAPAVFGGNTEVSQRLTDTLLRAFQLCACSQGTMNNLLFGNTHFGFYETIGGGTGAGPGFAGSDGTHHHMTNTRITDAEIMEQRYPVRVMAFGRRSGSGGEGKFRGGEGLRRELYFEEDVSLSLSGEHRRQAPYGLKGGKPGAVGVQFLVRGDEKPKPLPGHAKAEVSAGDRIIIETPGGGGYGLQG